MSAKNGHSSADRASRSQSSSNSESEGEVSGPERVAPSPEFFGLTYEWDPGAANDEYYVASSDFIALHSHIKRFLLRRMLWWAASVSCGMTLLFFFFR